MAIISDASPAPEKHSFFRSLYFKVIVGIVFGIALGAFYPTLGEQMKPLGDAFIKLIKMVIAPIIFFTVVTGSGYITLAATLSTVGTIPVAGIALLLGVDRFMSEMRAITNIIGNGVATVVVSKWENEFDAARAARILNGEINIEDREPLLSETEIYVAKLVGENKADTKF